MGFAIFLDVFDFVQSGGLGVSQSCDVKQLI